MAVRVEVGAPAAAAAAVDAPSYTQPGALVEKVVAVMVVGLGGSVGVGKGVAGRVEVVRGVADVGVRVGGWVGVGVLVVVMVGWGRMCRCC
jgi:hypothetical protein